MTKALKRGYIKLHPCKPGFLLVVLIETVREPGHLRSLSAQGVGVHRPRGARVRRHSGLIPNRLNP